MEEKVTALKLLLDELGIPASIASVSDRKRIQKAVYLAQLSGVDLGYRFGWYLMGPYSTNLTVDYYQLAQDLQADPDGISDKTLKEDAKRKIAEIRPLLKKPTDFPAEENDWLELLASYHYLRKISGKNEKDALATLQAQKAHLAPFVSLADQQLRQFSLVG